MTEDDSSFAPREVALLYAFTPGPASREVGTLHGDTDGDERRFRMACERRARALRMLVKLIPEDERCSVLEPGCQLATEVPWRQRSDDRRMIRGFVRKPMYAHFGLSRKGGNSANESTSAESCDAASRTLPQSKSGLAHDTPDVLVIYPAVRNADTHSHGVHAKAHAAR
ncbi:hypothetical protein OH77DRAFT_187198 [Trametes cingulata]|nr:hypothetical protein OH77DRAFT_187198 [Trametes cingulata]